MLRRSSLRRLCVAGVAALLAPLVATGPSAAGQPASGPPAPDRVGAAAVPPLDQLTVSTTQVAFGLQRPTAIFAPDDGSGRLLITEKQGTIRVYRPDTGLAAEPLLDIRDRVDTSGNERGLLGVVTSPNFTQTRTLYVTYTALPEGTVTLSRFTLDTAGQTPIPAAREQVVLTQPHAEFSNHNGGNVAFGPDGYLYWSIGDGGGADDVLNSGQNLGTLLGKILRLDVSRSCNGRNYCVPADNPFVGTAGARPEIWAYGLRNPWKFSHDLGGDGSLWIADVGQGTFEEIDHLPGNRGGANFGWSCREGPQVFNPDRCQDGATYVEPVHSYRTSVDGCAVIGGYVYRGRAYADIAAGTYLATDYCSGTAFVVRPPASPGGAYATRALTELTIQPTSLGQDANGELYLVNDLPGQLHRISFGTAAPPPACTISYRVDQQWGTGFTATVVITNTGTAPINGWTVGWSFPAAQRADTFWNATGSQQGAVVTARNADWNPNIPPGGSTDFGFLASNTGPNPAPTSFTLNGKPCG
ncbi:PQQ-dependent sugar dehydrogenase [Micromonospora eburnea]|uniref:Glucose/arabinose dehydrogenase, beta-propeller fold n=1 Tax=Micromonospora eburnea TaxID=227316 RepID=A0A1C6UJR1_9ACTN|nr:PQQ-dependent sugar dehydrogenase [Micromonospora eburnea]SCL54300.1 Glucose/arabinose dehydrogenase, beta-propeller fold [Micromonospora eburnea]